MSKKVLSTADGTLDWGDAREGDWVRVNGKRHKVEYKCWPGVESLTAHYTDVETLNGLGAILERDVPSHPLEEAEPGTVIRAAASGVVYEFDGLHWYWTRGDFQWPAEGIDRLVGDDYEVLWPRPEPPKIEAGQVWRHEDGRTFTPTKSLAKHHSLVDRPWRGDYFMPKPEPGMTAWRTLATAAGLLAAGFRLDTEEDEQ